MQLPGETYGHAGACWSSNSREQDMRKTIAGLVLLVAGCSSYEDGPLGYSKPSGPIEQTETASDHSPAITDSQRQNGLQLQNAEYRARTTPMLTPSR